jgi:hypothetical protein
MEIQKADLALRKRAIAIIGGVALLLLIVAGVFLFWLHTFSTHLDYDHAAGFVAGIRSTCAALAAIALLVLGTYVTMRGRRIVENQRFPANDARVIFDTRIREAKDALQIGKATMAAGVVTCAAGLVLVAFVVRSIIRIL